MQYLVQMTLAEAGRAISAQDGLVFIESYVLPTLDMLKRLKAEGRLLAGGPVAGSIALALVFEAETVEALDALIESLPVWPRMNTTVTPLTTFDGRAEAVRPRLDRLRAMVGATR